MAQKFIKKPEAPIKDIRVFEVPSARYNRETYQNLANWLEDFKRGYGAKVYTNNNDALAIVVHDLSGHCRLENVKDVIVVEEYENGRHAIRNLAGSDFYSDYEITDEEPDAD